MALNNPLCQHSTPSKSSPLPRPARTNMVARKPRLVIVGAGMAGLSAAHQLEQVGSSCFDVILLEGGHRIGGRISTSVFGGARVELGATWIHGVEGSPVYEIAHKVGSLTGDMPWERQDGFPGEPVVRAEGGMAVDSSIVNPVVDLYKKMMVETRANRKLEKQAHSSTEELKKLEQKYGASFETVDRSIDEKLANARSIGAFVRQGLRAFLSQQSTSSVTADQVEKVIANQKRVVDWANPCPHWSLKSLQEAVFSMHEYMERVATAANSLDDLDLEYEQEYREYQGEHITIAKGYMSVLTELASCLPAKTIQFGKKVQKVLWNCSTHTPVLIHCDDGSVYEADHVIITVSLGVLKAGTTTCSNDTKDNAPKGTPINGLHVGVPNTGALMQTSLFEPTLPSWKLEAISKLGYGVVDKVFLLLNPSFAESEQLSSHIQLLYSKESLCPWWMRKTFSLAPIYKASSVVLCWFAGDEALEIEGLSDEALISGVCRTLAKFGVATASTHTTTNNRVRQLEDTNNNLIAESSLSDLEESLSDDGESVDSNNHTYGNMFSGVLRSNWGRNPLFNGSYSYVATGASGDDIETLAEPLPKLGAINHEDDANQAALQLLFAGEATDRHFYSTTHGAYRSGLREANRLLDHYGFIHIAV